MILAEVVGRLVAETRADKMDSPVYLIVNPVLPGGKSCGGAMIALDIIGAGEGEIVMVSQGSSTRQTSSTIDKPVDALIIGIVDAVSENGKEVYSK
jgi:microcompartment protein CcmK/EutM